MSGSVELQTFVRVIKNEGYTLMSVTRREGVEVGSGCFTLADLGPKAREIPKEGISNLGCGVRGFF